MRSSAHSSRSGVAWMPRTFATGFPSPQNSPPNRHRTLRFAYRAHLLVIHRRDIDMNIDPIHQRPGNLLHVARNHGLGTTTPPRFVVEESAWTRIHRRRQHKSRRTSPGRGITPPPISPRRVGFKSKPQGLEAAFIHQYIGTSGTRALPGDFFSACSSSGSSQ